MITVKVISESSGKPTPGRKVAMSFDAIGRGITSSKSTDSKGEVHFDADNGDGEVFVDGRSEHRGYLSGRIVIYI